jgi:hypothetical protein
MDTHCSDHVHERFKGFGNWVSRHCKRGAAPSFAPAKLGQVKLGAGFKFIKSGALFLTAVALSAAVYPNLLEQGSERYLRENWPTRDHWNGSLEHLGYEPVTDPKKAQAWVRHLSIEPSGPGQIWISADECTLALAFSPLAPEHIEIWRCRTGSAVPKLWNSLGPGWLGFLKIRKVGSRMIKRGTPIDPLEIRY